MMDTPTAAPPSLESLVEPLLGLPYAEVDCFELLRRLFKAGWALDLDQGPTQAAELIMEVWYQDDGRDPCQVVQPWDVLILRATHAWSSHVGIVVTPERFVHTRPRTGVVLEPLRRWRPWLLQVARLQRLMAWQP